MKKILFLFLFLISIGLVNAACTTTDCDNIGEIQNNQFCSVDGYWCDQLSDNSLCENSFECLSGDCFEGTCSGTSVKEEYEEQKTLLEQILNLLSGQECANAGEIIGTQYCDVDYKLKNLNYGGSACENDFECLSAECDSGICTCSSSDECDSGNVCLNDLCVDAECVEDSDCDAGYACTDNICVLIPADCTSNADCTHGICDTTEGECVECLTDHDCTSTLAICSSHICVSPSPGGSTSGGGGRTYTGSQGNSYVFEKTFSSVELNKLYSFSINELPIPVDKISFITNKALSNVKFTVKKMLEKSADIPAPEGILYSYFQLTTENMQDSDLEKAEINFRVSKDWLTQNNLKESKVVLQRYTSRWILTNPQMMAEDSLYYYFTALTPGFSWFAITSRPEKPTVYYTPRQAQAQSECGDGIVDLNENCNNCQDAGCQEKEICSLGVCIPEKKTSMLWFIIPVILVIVAAVGIILYKKYKKPKALKLIRPINTVKYYRK